MSKPHYPARFFHKLRRYPKKCCLHCGAWLMPRIDSDGKGGQVLENMKRFEARRYCKKRCSAKATRARAIRTQRQNEAETNAGMYQESICRVLLLRAMQQHEELIHYMGKDNPVHGKPISVGGA